MLCVQGKCSCLSLYGLEGRRIDLVLVGYDRRVLVLLQKLTFLESD
jgi:hypothetical protein